MTAQGQSGERKTYRSTASSSRFDDTPLAFSMKAYEHKEYGKDTPDVIWMFGVRRYCGGDDLIRIQATRKALLEMRSFIDRALEMIEPLPSHTTTEEGE
jgi:hypothetical protein